MNMKGNLNIEGLAQNTRFFFYAKLNKVYRIVVKPTSSTKKQ